MKILLIHRWFWPDAPPYASMLRSIATQLAADGHDVTVLTAPPSYTKATAAMKMPRVQQLDGVTVKRCRLLPESKGNWPLRALNMLLFMFAITRQILFRKAENKYEVVMASTMPPVLVAATARVCARKRGGSFIYHMMDIYPEIALTSDMAKDSWFTRWLASVDRRNCELASRVVVLSTDMRDALAARGLVTNNVEVLNNFQLESFTGEGSMPEGLEKPKGCFRLLFAGNIGRFQGLETAIDAVALLDDIPDLRFELLGDGAGRGALEELAGERLNQRIFFHGYQPIENAVHVLATADLCLIALNPNIFRYAYPSKTMTYLGVGAPLLLVIESESELAQMVEEEEVGYHAPQGDPQELAKVIRLAVSERQDLDQKRQRARFLAEREFTAKTVLPRWSRLFESLSPAS